ncbi:hypothetical protein BDW22DRAFT_1364218 [Trametopsis cervina]|nr:hypothetical protein BDW22DRAFT_1364218 [Trametopsis cervina]
MDQRMPRQTTFNNVPLVSAVHFQPQPQQSQQSSQQQQQQAQQQQQQQQRPPIQASQSRTFYQDAMEAQMRMEESLKRMVTLVFWYKAGCEPIRLHQELTTFPLFSLSYFTQLVSDLALQPNSYVDSFNPHAGTWEQQTITSVRMVESEQRLLFRIRKSLLEGMTDRDCLGLEGEIRMQPQSPQSAQLMSPPQKSLKRAMPDTTTDVSPPAAKQFRSSSMQGPFVMNQSNISPQAYQVPPVTTNSPLLTSQMQQSLSPSMHPTSPFMRQDAPISQPVEQTVNNTMTTSVPPLHNAAKRWPNDYAVCEISVGFDKMDDLIAQTPSLTQKTAFERIFRTRYVKSTVCRHRGIWRRADANLKETFKRMGNDERALWGEFVKKTDFKRETQKPKQQQQDEDDPLGSMDYGMSTMNPMNTLGLDLANHHQVLLKLNGHIHDAMNEDPPMASLGPPPS